MKRIKIIVLSILSVIVLIGCSSKQDEILKLEERINKLEVSLEAHSETLDMFEEITGSIDDMQEDIDSIKNTNKNNLVLEEINSFNANLESIKNEVNFLKRTIFGKALFDRNTILVGDTIKGMKLIEINENEGSQFLFDGQKKITGQFTIISDNDYWYDTVNFHVDDEAKDILPREIQDYRTLWFEFSNYDQAVELLSPYGTSGTVTIVIDQYCVKLLEGCVINAARIIDVETK